MITADQCWSLFGYIFSVVVEQTTSPLIINRLVHELKREKNITISPINLDQIITVGEIWFWARNWISLCGFEPLRHSSIERKPAVARIVFCQLFFFSLSVGVFYPFFCKRPCHIGTDSINRSISFFRMNFFCCNVENERSHLQSRLGFQSIGLLKYTILSVKIVWI